MRENFRRRKCKDLSRWSKVAPKQIAYPPTRHPKPSPHCIRTTMRWPPWSSRSPSQDDEDIKPSVSWTNSLNATDWAHYTDPRTVIPTILLTGTTLLLVRLYRSYLRRIPEAANIQPGFFRRRSLFGRVTSVGDGDNFRLFHTPGGRLAGWGWMPGRNVPTKREELKDRTVRPQSLVTPSLRGGDRF